MDRRVSAAVDLSYEVHGSGPVPVVFLHGFAASRVVWEDLWPLFPSGRFRLYLIDLKGFGFSPKPRDGAYSVADQAEAVCRFIEIHNLSDVVMVGHSLGGAVALLTILQLAAAGMPRVSRLILLSCSVYPQKLPRSIRWLRVPFLGWLLSSVLPVRLAVIWTLHFVFHDQNFVTPQRVDRYVRSFHLPGLRYALLESARQLLPCDIEQLTAKYSEIDIPTLIIWGRQDKVVPYTQGIRLHREMIGSEIAIIE